MIDRFDWPTAFLITAGFSAVLALIWVGFATDHPEGPTGQPVPIEVATPAPLNTPWVALLGHRSLILLTLSYATVNYFQYLFFYWMNYYFQTVLALPESTSRSLCRDSSTGDGTGDAAGGMAFRSPGTSERDHPDPAGSCP